MTSTTFESVEDNLPENWEVIEVRIGVHKSYLNFPKCDALEDWLMKINYSNIRFLGMKVVQKKGSSDAQTDS